MKVEKNKINELLALWIRWDAELWGELRNIQIKLLHQRIVKEMTFSKMAEYHDVNIMQLRKIFSAILLRVENLHGKQLGSLLRSINSELEAIETGIKLKDDNDLGKVFLN